MLNHAHTPSHATQRNSQRSDQRIGASGLNNGYLLAAVLRPFVTFGLLGGFTTFSFFAVQSVTLVSPRLGMLYLLLTAAAAIAAAAVGMVSTSALLNRRRPGRRIR